MHSCNHHWKINTSGDVISRCTSVAEWQERSGVVFELRLWVRLQHCSFCIASRSYVLHTMARTEQFCGSGSVAKAKDSNAGDLEFKSRFKLACTAWWCEGSDSQGTRRAEGVIVINASEMSSLVWVWCLVPVARGTTTGGSRGSHHPLVQRLWK